MNSRSTSQEIHPTSESDEFWDHKLTHNHSTFGASAKSLRSGKLDDPYIAWKEGRDWKGFDNYGVNHGRVRVASSWGRLTKAGPSPTVYDPKIDFQTKRETTPMLSMSWKVHDDYEEKKLEHKKLGMAYIPKYSSEEKLKKFKRPPMKKIEISRFENFNLEEANNAMTPGPGAYEHEGTIDKVVKFERQPKAFLAPRQRIAEPRNIIDFATLTINPDRYDFTPKGPHRLAPVGDHNKRRIAYTIGERRMLLNKSEVIPTGPGYYNLEKVFSIGTVTNISQGPKRNKG